MNDRTPKYANVAIKSKGLDGNALGIVSAARRALEKAGAPSTEISAFFKEALSGDYDNVLQTTAKWVGFKH